MHIHAINTSIVTETVEQTSVHWFSLKMKVLQFLNSVLIYWEGEL